MNINQDFDLQENTILNVIKSLKLEAKSCLSEKGHTPVNMIPQAERQQ